MKLMESPPIMASPKKLRKPKPMPGKPAPVTGETSEDSSSTDRARKVLEKGKARIVALIRSK